MTTGRVCMQLRSRSPAGCSLRLLCQVCAASSLSQHACSHLLIEQAYGVCITLLMAA